MVRWLGLGVTLLTAAFAWPGPTLADMSQSGELSMSATGKIAPGKLPRSGAVAASLRVGFTSEALNNSATPELSRIVLDIGRNATLNTTGLSSCSFAELYSSDAKPGNGCAKSLVGQGVVDSEIALPGRPPVNVEGRLSAFYVFRKEDRLILARVRTGAPLPLIYVIPFEIMRKSGIFGTSLVVQRMRNIQGICVHPNCFSPYTLKGVYSRISKLELSLHRRFADGAERESFVSAQCPAPRKSPEAVFPVAQVLLNFTSGGSLANAARQKCRVAAE